MIFKSNSSHNYIAAYFLFVVSFTTNIANLSCSYCSHCSYRDGVTNQIFSHCQNTSFIQLRSIVRYKEDEKVNSGCETLDIESDERLKFFFIETSQRDHLGKYWEKLIDYVSYIKLIF